MVKETNGTVGIPTYTVETQIINFDDGHWWAFRKDVTRRMRREFRTAHTGAMSGDSIIDESGVLIDREDPKSVAAVIRRDPGLMQRINSAVEDAWLIHGTTEWSFSDEVTPEALEDMPEKYFVTVLEAMAECGYREIDEDEVKN